MSAAAIPISPVVVVNITRETLFPTKAGFGTLLAASTTVGIPHGERVRFYTSIAGVAADFATTTDEYKMAVAYFSQTPSAERLGIGFVAPAVDQAGYLKGGTAVSAVATWQAVTAGSLALTVDGVGPTDILAMNFSTDTTMPLVAARIQAAVQAIGGGFAAVTVVWDATGFFTITSGTTGASSTILFATAAASGTAIEGSGFMGCSVTDGGTEVTGYDYVSLTDELDRLAAASDDWYGVTLGRQLYSPANYVELAAWVQAQTVRRRVAFAVTQEVGALDASVSSDLMSTLKTAAYDRIFTFYEELTRADEYREVAIASHMFTVDFALPNSASTAKFKRLPGVTPSPLSETQVSAVKGKFGNVYIIRGSLNMVEEGYVAVGEFFDTIHFVDWLEQEIAANNFGRMYSAATKIPYTDQGALLLENETRIALEGGVSNGGLAVDFDPNTGQFLPAFTLSTVPVAQIPAATRALRDGPPQTFTARLGSAIHFTTIAGTVTV